MVIFCQAFFYPADGVCKRIVGSDRLYPQRHTAAARCARMKAIHYDNGDGPGGPSPLS